MMSNLNIVIFSILFFIALGQLISLLVKNKLSLSIEFILSVIGSLSLIYWSIDQSLNGGLDKAVDQSLSMPILAIYFAVVPAISLASISSDHKHKRRISTRIPIISFLLAYYLKENFYLSIFVVASLVFTFMILKENAKSHLYEYRQFLWFSIFILPTILVYYLQIFYEQEIFRFIMATGFIVANYFYSRLLNAATFGKLFKDKLLQSN